MNKLPHELICSSCDSNHGSADHRRNKDHDPSHPVAGPGWRVTPSPRDVVDASADNAKRFNAEVLLVTRRAIGIACGELTCHSVMSPRARLQQGNRRAGRATGVSRHRQNLTRTSVRHRRHLRHSHGTAQQLIRAIEP